MERARVVDVGQAEGVRVLAFVCYCALHKRRCGCTRRIMRAEPG